MAETYKGWIKLYRQIKESAVWSDPIRLKAWIDILVSANTKDKEWFAGGRLVQIKRGQYVTSNRKLQEAWGCSQRTVSRILQQLEDLNMIKVETPAKRYTLVTVVNYGVFQDKRNSDVYKEGYTKDYSEDYTEGYTEGHSEGQQLKNNKNIKNDIRMNQEIKEPASPIFDSGGFIVED